MLSFKDRAKSREQTLEAKMQYSSLFTTSAGRMKYGVICAATVMALSLAAISARADVLMYSFEPGDSPNSLDGFANLSGNSLSNESTYGVTGGIGSTQAMQIQCTTAGFAGSATTSINAIMSSPTVSAISMDATVPLGTSYTGGYLLLGITVYDNSATSPYDGDSFQVSGSDEQSIYPLPSGAGTGVPQHIVIPLTGSDPISGNPSTYAQLIAGGWVTTGFEIFEDKNAQVTFAVDSVSAVVPEPASLLGMGAISGLLMLRRRRVA
jgi:hypothetical protein